MRLDEAGSGIGQAIVGYDPLNDHHDLRHRFGYKFQFHEFHKTSIESNCLPSMAEAP